MIWSYVKCVYWNKWTLFGFTTLLISIVGIGCSLVTQQDKLFAVSVSVAVVTFCIAVVTLCFTTFGIETLHSYLRTKRMLESGHEPVINKEIPSYCNIVGIRAAFREDNRRYH